MKPIVSTVLLTAFVAVTSQPIPAAAPAAVVGQVHVISVHVPDHARFDAVFRFFRDTLRLPRVYGELSSAGKSDERCYAGFSVGNAYLEPCGPYASDPPFSEDRPTRFVGLTCSPGTTLADAVGILEQRGIGHSEVMGGGTFPRFVYLNDPLLVGNKMALGLWQMQNTNDPVNLNFLQSSLREAQGGILGVERIEEVRLTVRGSEGLAQWKNFLLPALREGERWLVGAGPALRLVPGDEPGVESIVLKVQSLEKAMGALSQGNLTGKTTPDGFELDRGKAWGLRIILKGG